MRLWVVLSCLWVLLNGVLAYKELSELYGRRTATVGMAEHGEARIVFSSEQSSSVKDLVRTKWIPVLEANPPRYAGQTVTTPYDDYLREHSVWAVARWSAVLLGVPLAVLLLGWSIAWIRRGFKHG